MTHVELTGERATVLAMLYGRALDAESQRPILGDHWARDVVEQTDVDVKRTGLRPGDEKAVSLRAEQLDDWESSWSVSLMPWCCTADVDWALAS